MAPFSPFIADNERRLEAKARHKIATFAQDNSIDFDGIYAELTVIPVGPHINAMKYDLP